MTEVARAVDPRLLDPAFSSLIEQAMFCRASAEGLPSRFTHTRSYH